MKFKLFNSFSKKVIILSESGYTLEPCSRQSFKMYQRARRALSVVYADLKHKERSLFAYSDMNYARQRVSEFRKQHLQGTVTVIYEATVVPFPGYAAQRITAYDLRSLCRKRREVIANARQVRRQLRERRPVRRSRAYGNGFHHEIVIPLVGGVHTSPGFFLQLRQSRLSRLVYENKYPKTNEHHLGLELEFTAKADQTRLGTALFEADVAEFVTLKSDGSIRVEKEGHYAHELVICVAQSMVESVTKKVTEVLSKFEASVNKSTGFHVHIDVRSRDRRKVFGRLVAAQSLLYAMQPASRRNNTYAKRTSSRDMYVAGSAGRYQGINPKSYDKHTTVEVRLHAGTVSFEKIVNWCRLLVAITEGESVLPPRAPRKLDSFCKTFGIGGELRDYIKARLDKFANVSDDQTETA